VAYPEELSEIAGNLGGGFSRNQLAAEIINQWNALMPDIETRAFLETYRQRSAVLGNEILIYPVGNRDADGILAQALSIDDDGGLVVQYQEGPKFGLTETLSSGEVSIRKV
jgi:BirA family transcriptional regulator, biotin operon repressor / biotin---[acetyl-CoA-carboxylase] ligase